MGQTGRRVRRNEMEMAISDLMVMICDERRSRSRRFRFAHAQQRSALKPTHALFPPSLLPKNRQSSSQSTRNPAFQLFPTRPVLPLHHQKATHIMPPPRPGDAFPNVDLWVLSPATPDSKPRQPVAVKPLDLFRGKRLLVVVGIPGPVRSGGIWLARLGGEWGRERRLTSGELMKRPSLPSALHYLHLLTQKYISKHSQFTPGCSKSHVPGFLEAAKELRAKGIDQVYVVSTADGKSKKGNTGRLA